MPKKLNKLTPEEERVILNKGTEAPGSGEYESYIRKGLYICRQCETPLYDSNSKFDAGCGWPSFDDNIQNAVKREMDKDGHRTEILCNNCGAHLGHVFEGENFTDKDTRHCVNSISMKFIPEDTEAGEEDIAVLGGGCFWCLEAIFQNIKGIKSVTSGYAGGQSLSPTYENINSHAEVIKLVFDEDIINYEQILEIFFTMHDPTQIDRQGNDVGTQYRSIILYQTLVQKRKAEEIIKKFETEKIYSNKIVTDLKPLIKFHKAEDYHQDYYKNNSEAGYCQAIINPKLKKLRDKYNTFIG